jgi:hypothetical protein
LNRKLLLLDVALAAGAIYGGMQLHGQWVAANAREAEARRYHMTPAPPPRVAPLPQEPAVLPSGYKDIAVKTLFDKSRNPDIPVEVPPPPPPPKEPPPLPSFHGMMDFGDGDGPIAMMSIGGTSGQQEVHAGGMIGPFKLVSFTRREIALEWDGRIIHKRVDEAGDSDKSSAPAQAQAAPVATGGVIPGVAAPQAQAAAHTAPLGPGQDLSDGSKACQSGDSNPAGTVVNGYRKDVRNGLFSQGCSWTMVGK